MGSDVSKFAEAAVDPIGTAGRKLFGRKHGSLASLPGTISTGAEALTAIPGGPTPPGVPELDVPTEEEVQEQAKKSREHELIRRSGTRGRASTIKTGGRGLVGNFLSTFKQLRGR